MIKKNVLSHVVALFSVIIAMIIAMVLVYCIPNSLISENVEQSLRIIGGFGNSSVYSGAKHDNGTDEIMVYTMLKGKGNPIYESMYNLGYPRYWHGYSVFLRPLFLLFDVGEVWFLIGCIFLVLFTITVFLLWKKLGKSVAIAFFASILCLYVSTILTSLQFSGVFNITFIFVILLLLFKDKVSFNTISVGFMVVGMITNFIDFLTIPLITLGIPLIVYIISRNKKQETTFLKNLKVVIILSLVWLLGYSFTWVTKWCLGTWVTGVNVFKLALEGITERGGLESGVNILGRISAVYANMATLFKNKFVLVGIGFVTVILIVFACVFRVSKNKWKSIIIFFVTGAMPYVWYFVLSNHSLHHNWFTYRAQFITLFSGLYVLSSVVDWNKCADWLRGLKKFKKEN